MKALGIVILALLFSGPVRAQMYTSAYSTASLNGGGGINALATLNNMGGAILPSSPDVARSGPVYQNSSAHGGASFVPSTFVPYDKAVAQGQAALVPEPPKQVAQVAAEYRNSKRVAARLTIVQDANGKILKESH